MQRWNHYCTRNQATSCYLDLTEAYGSFIYSTPTGIYRELDLKEPEFRLLLLQPGTGQIRCTLQHAWLFEGNRYETISYCWGNSNDTTTISVDGQDFDAPASAVEVLKAVRSQDEQRLIWIDAICINQANMLERNYQVALMGSIYGQCTRNLVNLGEQDDASTEALQNIEELWEEMRMSTDGFKAFSKKALMDHSHIPPRTTLHEDSLLKFWSRAWFS